VPVEGEKIMLPLDAAPTPARVLKEAPEAA
jgi:hypothetical protein